MSTSKRKTYVQPKVGFPKPLTPEDKEHNKRLVSYLRCEKIWDVEPIRKLHREFCENHPARAAHAESQARQEPNQWRSDPPTTFDECAVLLEAAGFVKLTDTRALDLSSGFGQGYRQRDFELRSFQLWAHPSGLLAECSSSGVHPQSGYPTFNSLEVRGQIDIGLGRLSMVGGQTARTHGSSNYNFQPTGGHAYVFSSRSRVPEDVLSLLEDLQKTGRILPFDQQLRDPFMGTLDIETFQSTLHPLLTVEGNKVKAITDDENPEDDTSLRATVVRDLVFQSWDLAHARAIEWNELMPGLGRMLLQQYYFKFSFLSGRDQHGPYIEAMKELAQQKNMEMDSDELRRFLLKDSDEEHYDWRRCEQALLIAERAAGFALERYPSPQDRELLRHVVVDVIGKPDVNWDEVNRASTAQGIHVGSMLTAQMAHHPEISIPRWSKLLQSTDPQVVRAWCTIPDASGKTLPMHLLDASFYAREMISYRNEKEFSLLSQWDNVLNILNNACPADQWVTSTDTCSPWGMWINHFKGRSMSSVTSQPFQKMLQSMTNLGASISSDVVWRQVNNWDYKTHSITPAQTFHHASIEDAIKDIPEFNDPQLFACIMDDLVGQHVPAPAATKRSKM